MSPSNQRVLVITKRIPPLHQMTPIRSQILHKDQSTISPFLKSSLLAINLAIIRRRLAGPNRIRNHHISTTRHFLRTSLTVRIPNHQILHTRQDPRILHRLVKSKLTASFDRSRTRRRHISTTMNHLQTQFVNRLTINLSMQQRIFTRRRPNNAYREPRLTMILQSIRTKYRIRRVPSNRDIRITANLRLQRSVSRRIVLKRLTNNSNLTSLR